MAVEVYSTPTCPHCHHVKSYLRERNIQFRDYNVASDQRKAEEMVRKTGQMGVPVINFNGNIIVGFDKTKLDRLIAKMS